MTVKVTHDGERWSNAAADAVQITRSDPAWPVRFRAEAAAIRSPDAVEPVIIFRDYLIAHPDEAQRYESLKRELAAKFATDRDGYTRAKDGFVREVLRKATASG